MMFKLLILSTAMMMTLSIVSGQDCPIAGQERVECASPCNTTCSDYLMSSSCVLTLCIPNGCQCPAGSVINEQTNSCIIMENCPKDGLTCPSVTALPAVCIIACNNNSDCERDLLCCSTSCGGRLCSKSVEKCAEIACPAVACTIGGIPAGECCTVCGCLDTDRQFVKVGDTFMDDCNTCTCGSDNVTSCTEMVCNPGGGGGAAVVVTGYTLLAAVFVFISSFTI